MFFRFLLPDILSTTRSTDAVNLSDEFSPGGESHFVRVKLKMMKFNDKLDAA